MGNSKGFDKIKIMKKDKKRFVAAGIIVRNQYPVMYIIFMPPKNLLKPH